MINAKNVPIDVEEVRHWAVAYRNASEPPLSWAQFSAECGIAAGTLQPFVTGTYQAKDGGSNIARKMFQFMQAVEAKTKRQEALPENPGYFVTKTSKRLQGLLESAHYGRITVGATGPGTGKSMSIKEYREMAQPTFVATMRPSTQRLLSMILEVHRALGIEPRRTTSADASQVVVERLRGRGALLIIDEANWLNLEAIEEIRSWHDECGVGVALFGNEELLMRIETGKERDQLARLNRRIADRHVQQVPEVEDVDAFCDAWGIEQPDIRRYLKKIARTPDAGGLGECQQLIEAASLIAAGEDRGLTLPDLRDVQMMRATRWIKA